MAITNSTEKFCYELGDVYNAEHQIVNALEKLIGQASDPNLKNLLREHLDQTRNQIDRLDQVWTKLGRQPQQVACEGMAGILAEGNKTAAQAQSPALRDGIIGGGADKVEHYEISSYTSLIMGAKLMGQGQIADLLQQNLQEEQWMAQQLEQSAPMLAQKAMTAEGMTPQDVQQTSHTIGS